MTDAPENPSGPDSIWIFQVADGKHPKAWWQVIEEPMAGNDEADIRYVRADLVDRAIAQARHEALMSAADALVDGAYDEDYAIVMWLRARAAEGRP